MVGKELRKLVEDTQLYYKLLTYLFLEGPSHQQAMTSCLHRNVGFHCIQLKSQNSIQVSLGIMKTTNNELSIATNTRYTQSIIPQ